MSAAPSRTPRVIFINRFYWPDEPATGQLLTDLAESLAQQGHDVTVITSHTGRAGLPRRQVHHGVTIHRVSRTCGQRLGPAGKLVAFAGFFLSALWQLLFLVRRRDRVVVLTDPPLLGIGVWIVARLSGAQVFHWVQDIYPEIAMALTGHRWLRVLRPLRNFAWRRSDGCVTLGSDMATTLARAGVPAAMITLCPNWAPAGLGPPAPEAVAALRQRWQLEQKFIVAYSGNLGRVHDLSPLLAVADLLRNDPHIVLVFIGGGPQCASLEAETVTRGLANVRFHPSQPRDELTATLAVGDLHFVTLLPGCEQLVFPSKLYGVAAVGRPVIVVGPRDCELARIVTEQGLGRAFVRDEIEPVAATIRSWSTDPAGLARLAAAAKIFGRAHLGPASATVVWQRLFAADRD
jgi:colanic acid biosynthesis glycosyl transferase WcaI